MPRPTPPRQLPLPLAVPQMMGAPRLLPRALVPPHTVWTSLSPLDRVRVRRTLITLLQEVARVCDAG
jgi:hypothetical protein